MSGVGDGVIPTVFGVLLVDGYSDAYPGEAEFRGGRLVRIEFGHFRGAIEQGMTVGFTTFPGLDPSSVAPPGGDGRGRVLQGARHQPGVRPGVPAAGEDLGLVNARPGPAGQAGG
jgi:hypothetical protein